MRSMVILLGLWISFIMGCMEDRKSGSGTTEPDDSTMTESPAFSTQTAKLSASDESNSNGFGHSVSASGDTIIIGADQDEDNGEFSGAAYIFIRSENVWFQQAKLLPDDGKAGDNFGESVSLSGDYAMIGTRDGKSAYIFHRTGESWSQQVKLVPEDPGDYYFGSIVSISGDYAVTRGRKSEEIPNNASVYVFQRSGETWTLQTRLIPQETENDVSSLALHGNDLLVGDTNAGAVYVFTHYGQTWTQQAKLVPGDSTENDAFGHAVAISGDDVIISNGNHPFTTVLLTYSIYIFHRDGTTWTQQAQFGRAGSGGFGYSVALHGDYALAGAVTEGYAVVYSRSEEGWKRHAVLNPDKSRRFGYSVALGENYAVVGDIYGEGTGFGAVYIYE